VAVRVAAIAVAANCTAGNVCFYTGQNGTGSMCKWSNADNDWTAAPVICSWAKTNHVSRIGCTRQGVQGNLAGTYQLRSHEWTTGSCG
jgi:hypothetical protein